MTKNLYWFIVNTMVFTFFLEASVSWERFPYAAIPNGLVALYFLHKYYEETNG